MATIDFRWRDASKTVTVPASGDGHPWTLLDAALANGVPMLCSCRSGDCGACRVEVFYPDGQPATVAPPTPSERLHQAASRLRVGSGPDAPVIRLACQYRLGEGTLRVNLPVDLGAF